jgi:hypothetical protein
VRSPPWPDAWGGAPPDRAAGIERPPASVTPSALAPAADLHQDRRAACLLPGGHCGMSGGRSGTTCISDHHAPVHLRPKRLNMTGEVRVWSAGPRSSRQRLSCLQPPLEVTHRAADRLGRSEKILVPASHAQGAESVRRRRPRSVRQSCDVPDRRAACTKPVVRCPDGRSVARFAGMCRETLGVHARVDLG